MNKSLDRRNAESLLGTMANLTLDALQSFQHNDGDEVVKTLHILQNIVNLAIDNKLFEKGSDIYES